MIRATSDIANERRVWVEPSRIVAGRGARLRLRFQAKDVYLVLGGSGRVQVLVKRKPARSIDVGGTPRLYTVAHFPSLAHGLLELRFPRGVDAYAFTFG